MFQHHTVVTVIRTGYGWQTSRTVGYRSLIKMYRSCLRTRSMNMAKAFRHKKTLTKRVIILRIFPLHFYHKYKA